MATAPLQLELPPALTGLRRSPDIWRIRDVHAVDAGDRCGRIAVGVFVGVAHTAIL